MYRSLLTCLLAAAAVPAVTAAPASNTPPYGGNNTLQQYRQQQVKDAFQTAWDGYYKYAFPNDELHPISNTFSNSYGGYGASAIDALSTAIIMEKTDIVSEIVNYVPSINWAHSYNCEEISLFETTIRYVAGLLAGHDLLKGPFSNLGFNESSIQSLLSQAANLADTLSYAFDTATGIPQNNLFPCNRSSDNSATNGLATIGSLVLEWTHLSDLTGNQTYAELTQKGESYLLHPQPASSQPFPGLVGTNVNISNGHFLDAFGGWIGGDDSFYEYLIKSYVYNPQKFAFYKDRWELAAQSTINNLTSHPSTRPDLTFVAEFNGTELITQSEHLACFDGGNFLLGGTVLGNEEFTKFGLALVEGCHDTYAQTLTHIGPEIFGWSTNGTEGVPADQLAFYKKAGFYIVDGNYILRPEVLESFYYAYRVTGNQKYRDWAWNAFVAINTTCRTGSGYAELLNVNAPHGGGFNDFQDSFFFAEVLKYSYIIQLEDNAPWQVQANGKNTWVFNTEAHPFAIASNPNNGNGTGGYGGGNGGGYGNYPRKFTA